MKVNYYNTHLHTMSCSHLKFRESIDVYSLSTEEITDIDLHSAVTTDMVMETFTVAVVVPFDVDICILHLNSL